MVMICQVFEHEATVRVMAGASPARSFERRISCTLRRRHRQLSGAVAADRLKNAVPDSTFLEKLGDRKAIQDCLNVMTRMSDASSATY